MARSGIEGEKQELPTRSPGKVAAWVAALAYVPAAWWAWPLFPDVFDLASEGRTLGRFVELGIAGLWVPAGLVTYLQGYRKRVGALMMLNGWLMSSLALIFGADSPSSFTLGLLLHPLSWPLWTYLVLAYPEGRLHGTLERVVVGADVFAMVFYGYLMRLFWEPSLYYPEWQGMNGLLVWDRPDLVNEYFDTFHYSHGALRAGVLAGIFVARLLKTQGLGRRIALPLAGPVVVFGVLDLITRSLVLHMHVSQVFLSGNVVYDFERPHIVMMRSAKEIALFLVPLGLLGGLELARRRRRRVLEVVTELGREDSPDEIEEPLRRALGDPRLKLVYPSTKTEGFVDASGAPIGPLPPDGPVVMTPLRADGILLAGVIHDRALSSDPRYVEGLASATRLAAARNRLVREIRDQATLADAEAAVEAERRRIGRDLHDGAQQRLANLALLVEMAKSTADTRDAKARLDLLRDEVDAAISDVRRLARGLAPPTLDTGGLASALRELAQRVPQVQVTSLPERPLAAELERTAFFVASEAVTNALKHAHASKITIDVRRGEDALVLIVADDGHGGADPHGAGLRGLRQRATECGGSLSVESSSAGTIITATLPTRRSFVEEEKSLS